VTYAAEEHFLKFFAGKNYLAGSHTLDIAFLTLRHESAYLGYWRDSAKYLLN
jgi:hypothetical protein